MTPCRARRTRTDTMCGHYGPGGCCYPMSTHEQTSNVSVTYACGYVYNVIPDSV